MRVTIAAIQRRSRTVVGIRLGDRLERFNLDAADTWCPDEAIVRGWTKAVEKAREWGATAFTIVVNRPLLAGYLRSGWRIRSLAMLSAMRAFASATAGVELEFRYVGHRIAAGPGIGVLGRQQLNGAG